MDVLKAPEGYRFEADDDIYTKDSSCTLTLTLTKE